MSTSTTSTTSQIQNLTTQIKAILPLIQAQVQQAVNEVPACHPAGDYYCNLPEETQNLHLAVSDLYFALSNVTSYEGAAAETLRGCVEYADGVDPDLFRAAQDYIEAFED